MYHGSCHCGRITFEVEGECKEVIECNCSICSRKGYLLWFVPREKLSLKAGEGEMTTYHFNRKMIDHNFCPTCGCAPFGLGTMPNGVQMAAINARCLEDLDLSSVSRKAVNGKDF